MTQATRKQLKPADSRQTCHSAALRPQHGFSQFDLTGGERDRDGERGGETPVKDAVGTKINGRSCCGVILECNTGAECGSDRQQPRSNQ